MVGPKKIVENTEIDEINLQENQTIKKSVKDGINNEKKKRLLLFVLIFFLSVAVAGLIIYLLVAWKEEKYLQLIIDSNIQTTIDPEDTTSGKIKYLPGDTINATLSATLENYLDEDGEVIEPIVEDCYLRFSYYIFDHENNTYGYDYFSVIFDQNPQWIIGTDGYCYYKGVFRVNESLSEDFKIYFIPDKDNNKLNGKTASICFKVEVLEADSKAIDAYWRTAPDEWQTTVETN